MDMTDPKIKTLRASLRAIQQELENALTFHEVWKPAAYDKALHERMGVSYATNAFHVIRFSLRRETLLGLMRLWDRDPRAIGLECIADTLRDSAVMDALVAGRVARMGISGVDDAIRRDLVEKANDAIAIVSKYSSGGSLFGVRERLRNIRNERLAHRQLAPSPSGALTVTDEEVEAFYQDMFQVVSLLLGLVEAVAYDFADTAGVYKHYATFFWAAVRGEKTEGHPNYRPPLLKPEPIE